MAVVGKNGCSPVSPSKVKVAKGPPSVVREAVEELKRPASSPDLVKLKEKQGSSRIIREACAGLYAGKRPAYSDLVELKREGVRTVVNLEDSWSAGAEIRAKEARDGRRLGLDVVSIPFSPVFPVRRSTIKQILDVIEDPARQPAYVHCQLGRERTNLVVALYRMRNLGWSPAEAQAAMLDEGYRASLVPAMTYQFRSWCRKPEAVRKRVLLGLPGAPSKIRAFMPPRPGHLPLHPALQASTGDKLPVRLLPILCCGTSKTVDDAQGEVVTGPLKRKAGA